MTPPTKTETPIMVAIDTVHYGEHGFIRKGDRMRADDPVVKQHSEWFVADGSGTREAQQKLAMMHYPDPEPEAPKPVIMVRARRDFDATFETSRLVAKGEVIRLDDQIVSRYPRMFEKA